MTKPLVFNYKRYEELREAYKQLLEDNQKLMADNRRLREELSNLIVPKVAYMCDGRACDMDCWPSYCHHTTDIEHATNFVRIGDRYVEDGLKDKHFEERSDNA